MAEKRLGVRRARYKDNENDRVVIRDNKCFGKVKGAARGKRYSIDDKELFKGEEFFFPPPEPS